ncbi:unnamed protein product [Clonostachys rosea f. rosea IK726]|uniref:Uncharacterized protein n=1 Tax=Clonostachys rosea f. rosea IK726 TaxID=1349383 RepID=A0ACA9UVA4_BIOOC|nr:unnamed protein product [Clonostachys rosea f. rosea IK726]
MRPQSTEGINDPAYDYPEDFHNEGGDGDLGGESPSMAKNPLLAPEEIELKSWDDKGSVAINHKEPKKTVVSNSRLLVLWCFALFHLPAIAITVALLALYIKQVQWNPRHPTSEELSILQFAAKAHETFILLSLTEVLLYRIRSCLLGEEGIPIGFLASAHYIVAPFNYLFSREFWGTAFTSTTRRLSHGITVGLFILLVAIGIGASPFSAIACIPRLLWWEVGNSTQVGGPEATTQYIHPETVFQMNLTTPYHVPSHSLICGIMESNSPGSCRQTSVEPMINELFSVVFGDEPYIPHIENITSTRSGFPENARPISLTVSRSVPTSPKPFGAAFATASMYFTSLALINARKFFPQEDRNTPGMLQSRPSKADEFPLGKWKQPLVAVNCNATLRKKDSIPSKDNMMKFSFYENSFHRNFSLELEKGAGDLKFLEEFGNGSAAFNPVFLDIQDKIDVPISAAILFAGNVSSSPGSASSTTLCLVQARWVEAEAWMNVNESPNTHVQLEVPLPEVPEFMTETSTAENVIQLGHEWLGAMDAIADSQNFTESVSAYGEAWRICRTQSLPYCMPVFISVYLTDFLTFVGELQTYIPPTNPDHNPAATPPDADQVIIDMIYSRYRSGYSFKDSMPIPIAFAVLLLHAIIAIAQTIWILAARDPWYSVAWESFGEMIALALRSKDPGGLHNIGGGIKSSKTWSTRVAVREVSTEGRRLELVMCSGIPSQEGTYVSSPDPARHAALRRVRTGMQYS